MVAPERVAPILLAAGRSERFGEGDKLAVPLGGCALREHAARTLASLPFAWRIAVVPEGRDAPPGFQSIVNADPAAGQARSIALGVVAAKAAGAEAVLIALADMPMVGRSHLLRLLAAGEGAETRVATGGGAMRRGSPALFGATHFDALIALSGDRGAQALLADAAIVVADPIELIDVDRAGDVAAFAQDAPIDPWLLHAWLAARSLSRDLPAPVADEGGWLVATGAEAERSRHVFAMPGEGIRRLGSAIHEPATFLKMIGDPAALSALLPPRWHVEVTGWAMTGEQAIEDAPILPGYRIELARRGEVTEATISGPDGDLAARGFAAEADGVFIYDRIVVEHAHRRRGVGRALMLALGAERRSPASRRFLVATDAGRALYETLGWSTIAPYVTAMIPAGT